MPGRLISKTNFIGPARQVSPRLQSHARAARLRAMFTPKWKQEAKHLAKGARKFVHYKRDLLKPGQLEEIESRHKDLLDAIKSGDRAQVDEASKQIRAVCENALPREKPVGWLEENVEVMFVAIVIALGLRAYYLQPFRIPTGSMQPTLNGIIGKPLAARNGRRFPSGWWRRSCAAGPTCRSSIDQDRRIAVDSRRADDRISRDLSDDAFFSRTADPFHRIPRPLRLPAPVNPMPQTGLRRPRQPPACNGGLLPKGTVLCEGTIDSGDLVLVDKFSYHFRKPKRGEVFVFDTIGIRGIHERKGDQAAGSHYIKRLCGVPGDALSHPVRPICCVDGKIAREPGIQRVIRGEGRYQHQSERLCASPIRARPRSTRKPVSQYLVKPTDTLTLAAKARPGMREYAALGDNTGNSLDSRYWGPVKEFNLVGPALFSLWPVTTGHWGFIR